MCSTEIVVVCLSVAYFLAAIAPREQKFRTRLRWYLDTNYDPEFWIRSLGVPFLGLDLDPYEGFLERSQKFKSIGICTYGLIPNPARVHNFQYKAWWYSLDKNFFADNGPTQFQFRVPVSVALRLKPHHAYFNFLPGAWSTTKKCAL
jgi:hypothetical protein